MTALRKQRLVGAVRVAALAVLLLSATASAQEQGDGPINCDANNNPAPETEDQREGRLACELHAGCRFLVVAVVRATCKAGDFFRKLGEREDPALPVTSSDVADAATPDYPESEVADGAIAEARNYANQSTQGRGMPGSMITTPDGRAAYAETRENSPAGPRPYTRGTLIYADGTIARGAFNPTGGQFGPGQVVTPDGRLKAGSFSLGQLGRGTETFREPDGRTSILEGTFCGNDNPCNGEMVRRYSDGTSRREVWFGGVAVTLGELAAKSEVPPRIPLADAAPPEAAIWTPAKGEGLKIESNADGREYEVLFCNGQVMDQGLWGERGKAPRIVRRDCRQPGPDGLHLVTNTTGFQRYELWCGGKIIDYYSIWNRVGTTAPLPRQQRCEQPQIVQHENEEIVQNDAIERTLGNGRLVAPPAYSSVCMRNIKKLESAFRLAPPGGMEASIPIHSAMLQVVAPCRATDPALEEYHQAWSRIVSSPYTQSNPSWTTLHYPAQLAEIQRAISDPNYSAELGPAR